MPSSTAITHKISSMINLHSLFIVAAIFLVCCCTIQTTKANEIDQAIDNYDPIGVVDDEMELFQRAAPRLGRASPRLGRASPRLGRRTISSLFTRFNHAGRYRDNDDDSNNDNGHEFNAWMHERRAAPRLGR